MDPSKRGLDLEPLGRMMVYGLNDDLRVVDLSQQLGLLYFFIILPLFFVLFFFYEVFFLPLIVVLVVAIFVMELLFRLSTDCGGS